MCRAFYTHVPHRTLYREKLDSIIIELRDWDFIRRSIDCNRICTQCCISHEIKGAFLDPIFCETDRVSVGCRLVHSHAADRGESIDQNGRETLFAHCPTAVAKACRRSRWPLDTAEELDRREVGSPWNFAGHTDFVRIKEEEVMSTSSPG